MLEVKGRNKKSEENEAGKEMKKKVSKEKIVKRKKEDKY